jgi:hypothetical protein
MIGTPNSGTAMGAQSRYHKRITQFWSLVTIGLGYSRSLTSVGWVSKLARNIILNS